MLTHLAREIPEARIDARWPVFGWNSELGPFQFASSPRFSALLSVSALKHGPTLKRCQDRYKFANRFQLVIDSGEAIVSIPMETEALSEQERKAILCVCIQAAFADGSQDEVERAQVEKIVNGFSGPHPDLASAYQDMLSGKLSLAQVTAQLPTPAARTLAYEMAVCVCNADGVVKDTEKQFLADLRRTLQLDNRSVDSHEQTAHALVGQPLGGAAPPVIDANRDAEVDRLILNAAILNGALEIMPHSLATMAIVPLQMRMVYQVGKLYGYELDRGHITDFLATVGIGLSSQVVEGFARRLVGGLTRGLAGGLLGGLAGQAAGSAFAFASTYALGQVAKRYYSSNRTLSTEQLKDVFSEMLNDAKSMQGRYSRDIAQKAQQVNVSQLLPLVRQ
jgi:uncharacterized protein (DUF697 family)/tellurite resistance protein